MKAECDGPGARESAPAPERGAAGWGRGGGWLAAGIFFYGAGHLIWHLGTPLGRAPQLDGAEILTIATQIATGTLPHEPFYRAMLYPAMLAAPLWLGWPTAWLPQLAAGWGLVCHFAATLAVARLAKIIWRGPRENGAAGLAAGLWGFNPVALFYAVDALDITFALALFLWGLAGLAKPEGKTRGAVLGGLWLGLAVAARPNFLPVVVVAPLARAWLAGRGKFQWPDWAAWLGAAAPLMMLGAMQAWWGGGFGILPAQGPYNLYAANRPGANGRYYTQQIFFTELAPGENPARKEAEILYAQARKEKINSAPPGVYWTQKAWEAIDHDRLAWVQLLGKKAYYLANDFDQYNNKTFAWHAAQSPWLWWNFLSWGWLWALGAGGVVVALAGRRMPVAGIILVAAAYGAGVLLYYASGRFRLPLAPLLCVLAGGWMGLKGPEGGIKRGWIIATMSAAGVALIISFSTFFEARDDSTFIQDELLSANAAAQVGDDAAALALAEKALARDAHRQDARRIAALSYFNLALTGKPGADSRTGWTRELAWINGLERREASLVFAEGMAWWKLGDQAKAQQIWEAGAAQFGPNSAPAQAALAAKVFQGANATGLDVSGSPLINFLQKPAAP